MKKKKLKPDVSNFIGSFLVVCFERPKTQSKLSLKVSLTEEDCQKVQDKGEPALLQIVKIIAHKDMGPSWRVTEFSAMIPRG